MTSSPLATPTRESIPEPPVTPQAQTYARHTPFNPLGNFTPTPSTRTDVPLLPTNNPVSPLPSVNEKRGLRSKWRRALSGFNELLLGKEKASVYWYASLLSVIAALIVTFSSIFGWPALPIWEYLRHVTR